jgi:ADP-heptose:LPS heptosyltransferase
MQGRFVTIFPGASITERRWGAAKFAELVKQLEESGIFSVVIGGSEDVQAAASIVKSSSAINLAGRTNLATTAAVISLSDMLVSGDSGILHLGVGLGVPTTSLFGPGIETKWAPRGRAHTVINKRLHCSPCTRFGNTPPCRIAARCLLEISVEEVYSAVITSLHKSDTSRNNIFTVNN